MADNEALTIIRQGPQFWNAWRKIYPRTNLDLSEANLEGLDLRHINLSKGNLSRANLKGANLYGANLEEAILDHAQLNDATLNSAKLIRVSAIETSFFQTLLRFADLTGANLTDAVFIDAACQGATFNEGILQSACFAGAALTCAKLYGADLRNVDFRGAQLHAADLRNANLTGAHVHGSAAWDVKMDGAIERDLVLNPKREEIEITVDSLELAHFVYLLLQHGRVRSVIDTVATKVVLILGRFTPERKAVLEVIRERVREKNLVPILFDWEKPLTRNTEETVVALAHMARFIVADVTEARSVLQELRAIVPALPSVPVQMIIAESDVEPGMLDFYERFEWVLPIYRYASIEAIESNMESNIIGPSLRYLERQ